MNKIKLFEEMLGVLAYNDPNAVKEGKIKKEVKKEVDNYDLPAPDDDAPKAKDICLFAIYSIAVIRFLEKYPLAENYAKVFLYSRAEYLNIYPTRQDDCVFWWILKSGHEDYLDPDFAEIATQFIKIYDYSNDLYGRGVVTVLDLNRKKINEAAEIEFYKLCALYVKCEEKIKRTDASWRELYDYEKMSIYEEAKEKAERERNPSDYITIERNAY